jgi:hypothetical protein
MIDIRTLSSENDSQCCDDVAGQYALINVRPHA